MALAVWYSMGHASLGMILAEIEICMGESVCVSILASSDWSGSLWHHWVAENVIRKK